MDLTVLGAVVAVVTVLVSAIKKASPKFMDGKEDLAAVLLSVALLVAAKLTGLLKGSWSDWALWVQFVVGGGAAGLGSGLLYDKWIKRTVGKLIGDTPEQKDGGAK